jgi:hypothetical protein
VTGGDGYRAWFRHSLITQDSFVTQDPMFFYVSARAWSMHDASTAMRM